MSVKVNWRKILKWEEIRCEMTPKGFISLVWPMQRTKVPGGWFVSGRVGKDAFFYPDPEHVWDGSSLA